MSMNFTEWNEHNIINLLSSGECSNAVEIQKCLKTIAKSMLTQAL
jgi:hypothetical protein